jgi:hypothetical protein
MPPPSSPSATTPRLWPRLTATLLPLLAAAALAFLPLRRGDAAETDWRRITAAVDAAVGAALKAAGVAPAPRSEDAEFLRRLYLDLVGTVPTAEEAAAFLADRRPDRRERQVEALLHSPAYADHWGQWWHRTLTGSSGVAPVRRMGEGARLLLGDPGETFRAWLHDQMAVNRRYDAFVADLLTASGRTDENGATGWYARWGGTPNRLAGAMAQTFLGVRIACAECHDHVYEPDWKQVDFQGMAAFWTATVPQRLPYDEDTMPRSQRWVADVQDVADRRFERLAGLARRRGMDAERLERLPEGAQQRLALAGTTPKFWMAGAAPDLPGIPRRLLLARWTTSEENPYFARALVNRYWGHFMGRGLVHPVDDFHSGSEASHPEVLALLADDFRARGHDLKRLVRILVNSETYQRTSRWSGAAPDPALFAKAQVRALTTEQVYFSVTRATGLEEQMSRAARRRGRLDQRAFFAAFAFVYDDDEMVETEDFAGSIPQGLFLLNGALVHNAVSARGGTTLDEVLRRHDRAADRVEALYLAAYARPPASGERAIALRFVERAGGDAHAWEDLFWSLLNSAEFMSNH